MFFVYEEKEDMPLWGQFTSLDNAISALLLMGRKGQEYYISNSNIGSEYRYLNGAYKCLTPYRRAFYCR